MTDKLMYIPHDDTQNYPVCRLQLVVKRLNIQLNQRNKIPLKFKKLLSQRIENVYKTLGIIVKYAKCPFCILSF